MRKIIPTFYFISVASLILGYYILQVPSEAIGYEKTPVAHPMERSFIIVTNWTQERIDQEIQTQAQKYNVSESVMHTVIDCESDYNKTALGDGTKSRGLVQIHSDYHDVSDAQAYDPKFAIEFLAEKLSKKQGYLWTCYRMHYSE